MENPQQTSATAIVALVLSLLGIAGVLPIIGSIIGGSLGRSSLHEIRQSNGAIGGENIARWAVRIGDFGIVIAIILIAIALWFFTISPILRQSIR